MFITAVFLLQAADLWALGVTLYTFVYGHLPFHDDNIVVLYDKIKNTSLTFPEQPFMSDDLKDLIAGLLNKNPAERLTLPKVKVGRETATVHEDIMDVIID